MATNSGGNLPTGSELGPNSPCLRLSDCLCPICMSILVEPVSMPCSHELCMPCFKQNVQEANLTCPMCRLRISNWARRAARENRLVNQKRWKEVLAAFPEQCRRRLEGEDDDDDYMDEDEELPRRGVCQPGEIREEYEKEMQKVRKQRHEEAEREVKRSEEYIQMLQAEEVKRFEEQRLEQERLRQQDEELARKLAEDDKQKELEEKRKELEKQAEEDARLAWKLQCEEQMMQSPRAVSTVSNSSSNSTGHRKLSHSRSSSNSSIKCLRIDQFLTPTPRGKSHSPSSDVIVDKFDINAPGTSKDIVVLTPSPNSNFSFGSDINKPGPSGIGQLEIGGQLETLNSSASASFLFDTSKEISLTRTSSNQSSNDSDIITEKPSTSAALPLLPVLDDLDTIEPKDIPQDKESQTSTRSSSVPCRVRARSNSAQSHTSTSSAPCHAARSSKSVKKKTEDTGHDRGRAQKKGGAFQKYTASSKEKDKDSERERSDSLSSVDSISHELSHFRPIQSSPRTARKKLADGSRESPPIIHATPRNLKEMKTPVGTESPFIDPPPLVRAKFEKLVEERHIKVEATSKGTMTSKKVQHWKKIARPEARKTGTIGASTKRKLSKFEFSSDGEGFMQPAKFQRIDSVGCKEKRTVGTQKAIPVKKRQVPIPMDIDHCQSKNSPQRVTSNKVHTVTCAGDSVSLDQPKKDNCVTLSKSVEKTKVDIKSSGAKRKILIDENEGDKSDLDGESVSLDSNLKVTSAAAQQAKSDQSSLESDAAVSPAQSSGSDTSRSKVYRMKLKVSKQGTVGSKVTPVKSAKKSTAKTSSEDVTKRKGTPVKRKVQEPSLPALPAPSTVVDEDVAKRKGTPVKRKVQEPSLPALPAPSTVVDEDVPKRKGTPVKRKVLPATSTVVNSTQSTGDSGNLSASDSDVNQSPENHRRGLRSLRLRNGTSPGKGILVETIQNGSKKDDNIEVVTKCKRVHDIKANDHKRKPSPVLNHTSEIRTEPESPKVKQSPRSRKKRPVSNPKVSSSPRTCKNPRSPPPPLKSLKSGGGVMMSPRTERRNTLWKYMELMTDEQKKLKQEEEDRRIALQLQKEFDMQEKINRNKVIRAKGTKDAYRLRHGSSSSVP